MESNKAAVVAFHGVCLIVTFSMMVYGTVKYYLDESTSIVDAKAFHDTPDDIYPVFTICLEMDFKQKPFNDSNHPLPLYSYSSEKNKNFNLTLEEIQKYVYFAMGIKNSEKTANYDYDNITVDVNDYLARVMIESGDHVLYKWEQAVSNEPSPLSVSYRHPLLKCFSLELSTLSRVSPEDSKAEISHLSIAFYNNDTTLKLFSGTSEMKRALYLHYPKQLIRSTTLDREHFGITSGTFSTVIYVDSVEVIRRRNTRTTPCDENYKQEDDMILRRLAEREGCSAPYWMLDSVDNNKPCTNASEMSKLLTPDLGSIDPKFLGQFQSEMPCSQVYGIAYSVKNLYPPPSCATTPSQPPSESCKEPEPNQPSSEENSQEQQQEGNNTTGNTKPGPQTNSQNQGNENGTLSPKSSTPATKVEKPPTNDEEKPDMCKSPPYKGIELYFKSIQYKEIKHIQSFNAESFIGNVGGYVGLFIGCALWEAPDFIEFLYRKMRGWIENISGFQNKQHFLDVAKAKTNA